MTNFSNIFSGKKPLIACIHLLPLPGSPLFDGKISNVFETALQELEVFQRNGVDGIIVENFRDKPFYPNKVPAETVASMSAVIREIVRESKIPIGVNVLRNDGESAIAVAVATESDFIRINVHMNAVVSDQGILQGEAHKTMRLRSNLKSEVLVFADVGVKHATPLTSRTIEQETKDVSERGLADAVIVSGQFTGGETDPKDCEKVRETTDLPILIGSGTTPENISKVYDKVDGFIVGSYFKKGGKGENLVEESRVKEFVSNLGLRKNL